MIIEFSLEATTSLKEKYITSTDIKKTTIIKL